MKLISHRGNIDKRIKERENTVQYIEEAIEKGFEVEIDLWSNVGGYSFFLGHDHPDTKISIEWIMGRANSLWIHCKNLDCLFALSNSRLKYFWHQTDSYTLTSNEKIWTYPNGSVTEKSIIVCKTQQEFDKYSKSNAYAICSDYVGTLK